MIGKGVAYVTLCLGLISAAHADWCHWNVTLTGDDVSTVDNVARSFYFASDNNMTEIRVHVDLPEFGGSTKWLDFIWAYGEKRGRTSAYGDFVFFKRGRAGNMGNTFKIKFATGYGVLYPLDIYVQMKVEDGSRCTRGRSNNTYISQKGGVTPVRNKRDLVQPKWIELDENEIADYIWVWPLTSEYKVNALAMAAGAMVLGNHEYVQLSTHEQPYNALFVPGMHVAGPNYVYSTDGGHFYQGRSLWKFSRRDAAWLLWNYETGKPVWNGNHDPDYWKHRSCAVPGEMPGLVIDTRRD